MLLKKSDKITWEASSLSSINHSALVLATSSEVNTDGCLGSEKERMSRPLTKALPTPSDVFDPSANVTTQPAY